MTKTPEHQLVPGAYTPGGHRKHGNSGRAKCSCGSLSATPLPTPAARQRWFERHTK